MVSVENDGGVIAFRDDTTALAEFKKAVDIYQKGPGINRKSGLPKKSTRYDVFEIIEVCVVKVVEVKSAIPERGR